MCQYQSLANAIYPKYANLTKINTLLLTSHLINSIIYFVNMIKSFQYDKLSLGPNISNHSATTKFDQFTKSLQNAVATLSRLIVKFREVRKFHFLSSICKCTIFLQVNCLVSKSQYFIDVASIYLSIFGFLKVDAFMLEFNTENMLAQLQDAPWIQKGSLVA